MREHLWVAKELWNELLAHTKRIYRDYGCFATRKGLREMVKHQGLYSQVAQELVDRLLDAIGQHFHFKRIGIKCGFPRLKSFNRMKSLCYPQSGFSIEGKKLKVTPFGSINIKLHRPIERQVKTLSLKRESSDRWFAIFVVETPVVIPKTNNGAKVGIDLGLKHFAVVSDGTIIKNPRHLRKHEKRLEGLQRQLSKKRLRSRNWYKASHVLTRAHEKVANTRRDFHHKLSNRLVNKYSLIALEDLSVKEMSEQQYGKSIHDAGWSSLI